MPEIPDTLPADKSCILDNIVPNCETNFTPKSLLTDQTCEASQQPIQLVTNEVKSKAFYQGIDLQKPSTSEQTRSKIYEEKFHCFDVSNDAALSSGDWDVKPYSSKFLHNSECSRESAETLCCGFTKTTNNHLHSEESSQWSGSHSVSQSSLDISSSHNQQMHIPSQCSSQDNFTHITQGSSIKLNN